MTEKTVLLAKLAECVSLMDDDGIADIAQQYVDEGHDPLDGITLGLIIGMNKAAALYEADEYFIPELLICSRAMENGLDILKPLIPKAQNTFKKCKIVIGVVEGDTHDIGKNLVKIMLESAGYELMDLGRDVPVSAFVEAVKNEDVKVVALSTLMTTTMENMAQVIVGFEEAGLRQQVKVIVGGAPISSSFAKKIGADGYSATAIEAVALVDSLVKA